MEGKTFTKKNWGRPLERKESIGTDPENIYNFSFYRFRHDLDFTWRANPQNNRDRVVAGDKWISNRNLIFVGMFSHEVIRNGTMSAWQE